MSYEKSEIVLLAHDHEHDSGLNTDDELVNSKGGACGDCPCRQRREKLTRRGLVAFILAMIGFLFFIGMTAGCHGMRLLKRQTENGDTTNDNGSAFTNQHLWIIIVCVVGIVPFVRGADGRGFHCDCFGDLYGFLLLQGVFPESDLLSLLYARLLWVSWYGLLPN
jgi:hypothetical protein